MKNSSSRNTTKAANSHHKIFSFAFNNNDKQSLHKLTNIIPEEDIDIREDINNMMKSPFAVDDLEYNKISAIGMNDITTGRVTSPFWD